MAVLVLHQGLHNFTVLWLFFVTQNCVINYIQLIQEKALDSYEKTLQH